MLRAVGCLLNQGGGLWVDLYYRASSNVSLTVNRIIVSVSDGNVLDDILAAVPGIDIVILPNILYANEQGRLTPFFVDF